MEKLRQCRNNYRKGGCFDGKKHSEKEKTSLDSPSPKLNKSMIAYHETGDLFANTCEIVESAQSIAYAAVDTILVQRNWLLGKRIAIECLNENGKADYGKKTMKKLSSELKENGYKISKAKELLARELDREPELMEIAALTELSVEEIVMAMDANREVESLYQPVAGTDGDELLLIDQLGSRGEGSGQQEDTVRDRKALVHDAGEGEQEGTEDSGKIAWQAAVKEL